MVSDSTSQSKKNAIRTHHLPVPVSDMCPRERLFQPVAAWQTQPSPQPSPAAGQPSSSGRPSPDDPRRRTDRQRERPMTTTLKNPAVQEREIKSYTSNGSVREACRDSRWNQATTTDGERFALNLRSVELRGWTSIDVAKLVTRQGVRVGFRAVDAWLRDAEVQGHRTGSRSVGLW
jgi:hypothetical protein